MKRNLLYKRLPLVVLLLSACLGATAQTRDVAFTAGVSVPLYKGVDGDVVLGASFSRYGASGLGWRAGFQYGLQVAEVDEIFGVPIAFGYRTPSRSGTDRLFSGAIGAADAAFDGVLFGRAVTTGNVLTSFLFNLFSDMEFFAGITPTWIAGPSSTVATSYTTLMQESLVEESWTEKRRPMTLTLDAGMCINYSIWRFDLKLMPVIHFDPFAPLVACTDRWSADSSKLKADNEVVSSQTPLRWFFTISGGLAYRF